MDYHKKSILVVGGGSTLAYNFIKNFDNNEYNIITISRHKQEYPREVTQINYDSGDLDFNSINIYGVCVAYIFASMNNIRQCDIERSHCYQFNVRWTLKLINILQRLKIKIIFLSTDLIYSSRNLKLIRLPQNYYAWTKLMVENYIIKNVEQYTILRLSKVLSMKSGILKEWSDLLVSEKKIRAFSNVYIAPINSLHVNDFLFKAIYDFNQQQINLCGDRKISYYELAKEICNKLKFDYEKIECVSLKKNGRNVDYHYVDLSSLNRIPNITYPKIENILSEIFKYGI